MKIFSSVWYVSFSFCWWFPLLCRSFLAVPTCLFLLPLLPVSYPKKSKPRCMSRSLLPVFSSRSVMVSGLMFKSLNNWVNFCVWCKTVFSFPSTTEESILSPVLYSWLFYHKLTHQRCIGLFLGSLLCSTDLCLALCHHHIVLIIKVLWRFFVWLVGHLGFFWSHLVACRISVSWPGTEPVTSVLGAQSLNHWATEEVPRISF